MKKIIAMFWSDFQLRLQFVDEGDVRMPSVTSQREILMTALAQQSFASKLKLRKKGKNTENKLIPRLRNSVSMTVKNADVCSEV